MDTSDKIFYSLFAFVIAAFLVYLAGTTLNSSVSTKHRIKLAVNFYCAAVAVGTFGFIIRAEDGFSRIAVALTAVGVASISAWCVKFIAYREEAWTTNRQLIGQFGYFVVGLPAIMLSMSGIL